MRNHCLREAIVAALLVLCAACAPLPTPPEESAEWRAPKAYRTGSNIAVRDYGGSNTVVVKPIAGDPGSKTGWGEPPPKPPPGAGG